MGINGKSGVTDDMGFIESSKESSESSSKGYFNEVGSLLGSDGFFVDKGKTPEFIPKTIPEGPVGLLAGD